MPDERIGQRLNLTSTAPAYDGGPAHGSEERDSNDKTLELYDGHFHDLLNDIDKDVVMADIESWIAAHLRG